MSNLKVLVHHALLPRNLQEMGEAPKSKGPEITSHGKGRNPFSATNAGDGDTHVGIVLPRETSIGGGCMGMNLLQRERRPQTTHPKTRSDIQIPQPRPPGEIDRGTQ